MQAPKFKEEFYKRLIVFSLEIIKFCRLIREDRNFWVIADQLLRSATSIGANVIEAKSSSSKKDYIHFFEIALKSANETKYWLLLVRESKPDLKARIDKLMAEIVEIAKIIGASILTMKSKK